jgi:hypothetical protein
MQPKGSLVMDRAMSMSTRHSIRMMSTPFLSSTKTTTTKTSSSIGKTKCHRKRKLSLKGKHNQDTRGDNFEILG